MKTLVIYDSVYGNTEQIARAIGAGLQPAGEVQVLPVAKVDAGQLPGLDLLVFGSPTQAFGMIARPKEFLKNLPANTIKGVKVAAFDTRMSVQDVDSKIFSFMAGQFGYAAEKIEKGLKAIGGVPVIAPEGFVVKGKEGPLEEGELERATAWAGEILRHL